MADELVDRLRTENPRRLTPDQIEAAFEEAADRIAELTEMVQRHEQMRRGHGHPVNAYDVDLWRLVNPTYDGQRWPETRLEAA